MLKFRILFHWNWFPINTIPALVQIMAWCRSDDKPLFELMMVRSPTHICHSASVSNDIIVKFLYTQRLISLCCYATPAFPVWLYFSCTNTGCIRVSFKTTKGKTKTIDVQNPRKLDNKSDFLSLSLYIYIYKHHFVLFNGSFKCMSSPHEALKLGYR